MCECLMKAFDWAKRDTQKPVSQMFFKSEKDMVQEG